jgi:hypothetical protein
MRRKAAIPKEIYSMPLTREQALAALGLSATPDADAATVQRAFERFARRYPQPSFPERFRQLLEARDELLDTGRSWRELVESGTLDLSWALAHLRAGLPSAPVDRRGALQRMLREGYLAEPLAARGSDGEDAGEIPF